MHCSMQAAFPCSVIYPFQILMHEYPCCRYSPFKQTLKTYLLNTLSIIDVSDGLFGNWEHDCVEFWFNALYMLRIIFLRLELSCSASWVSRPRVSIAQQLLIDCARYWRIIALTHSYPVTVLFSAGISAISSFKKIHLMMSSSVARLILSSDNTAHQIFAFACDWFSDHPVLWSLWLIQWSSCSFNKLLKLIICFSNMRFVEMGYPVRDIAAFKSFPHDSPPPFRLLHFCIEWVFTRRWRSGRPPVAWWMLIVLIRSPSCVITSSHKTRP